MKDFDKKYKSEAILLKAVLYHVEDFWKYIEPQKFVLDNTASTWKNRILLEHGWEKAVHKVLMGELDVPVIFDADVGHKGPQFPMVMGAKATITSKDGKGAVKYA